MNKESEDQEEPDWVQSEKEQFQQHRDKDGNGKLDRKELGEWVIPEDFDHAEAEAKHLIYEADTNKVKYLLYIVVYSPVSLICQLSFKEISLKVGSV